MKRIFYIAAIILAFASLFSIELRAQDPIFSQYFANPIYTNPALAGSNGCGRITGAYRNQWSAIPSAFSQFNLAYDQHFDAIAGSIGIIATNDRAGQGSYVTTSVGALYAYNLKVNDVFSLSAAVQATYVNRYINWEDLTFPDQFDERLGLVRPSTGESLPNTPTSKNYADFSAGIVGYTDWFYAGIAVAHLSRPDEGFTNVSRLSIKYTAHVGGVIDLRPKQHRFRDDRAPTLSPNIIYQQQGASQLLSYGLYANVYPMVFGVWARQNVGFNNFDALIFVVGVEFDRFHIGYSYDLNMSALRGVSGGSHEVSLSVGLPCAKKRNSTLKAINCPKF